MNQEEQPPGAPQYISESVLAFITGQVEMLLKVSAAEYHVDLASLRIAIAKYLQEKNGLPGNHEDH